MALTDKLTAIANAIRSKTGKTDGLTLEQMPGEIAGIQTGGDTTQEDSLVARTLTSYSNDRITVVGNYAFRDCTKLKTIDLPNVETVGSGSFYNISGIENIKLPKVKSVGSECFFGYPLSSISLPNLEQIFGTYAFRSAKITEIVLPKVVDGRNGRAFLGCSLLEKADFHVLAVLGGDFFSGCSALNALILRKNDGICTITGASATHVGSLIHNGAGYIYVPATLIEEYKVATNWSTYADQFRAIEDYPEICEVGV